MFLKEYDFATIAEYPELKDYLVSKLSELGEVNIRPMWDGISDSGDFIAEIDLFDFPEVKDWRKTSIYYGLHINSDAGGCFVNGLANCGLLPRPNSTKTKFSFSLSLDSRGDSDIYNPEIIKSRIDEFVKKVKIGFCYHFGGSYCRDMK